jgi:hypothetical protein
MHAVARIAPPTVSISGSRCQKPNWKRRLAWLDTTRDTVSEPIVSTTSIRL